MSVYMFVRLHNYLKIHMFKLDEVFVHSGLLPAPMVRPSFNNNAMYFRFCG